jgi:hypothetical protein
MRKGVGEGDKEREGVDKKGEVWERKRISVKVQQDLVLDVSKSGSATL